MYSPEQWLKIKEIVGAALEKKPAERAEFLDEACSQDAALRAEVESLLSAYKEAGTLSESPWQTQPVEAAPPDKTIGPYRLIRQLGIGGMGQVWLAEQTEPVRRLVALKLIKAGMFDASAVQRFQSERQSLAIMDHPAIAKIFDAGTTPDGQPYLVMEYVDGLPITDYCDRKELAIRERLALFLQVCEGVQHAHTKAIIHRDLKPTNILVAEVDGRPMPRLIDFGLAKAASPSMTAGEYLTQGGAFLGTPAYMSPEQADPLRDIDTRTDVYSLGVVLYELLAGFLPLDTAGWKTQGLELVLRHLREDEPQRPSARVGASRDGSAAGAAARSTDVRKLAALLRGDLDLITMKALEKDRDRRYGAPSGLAADIARYLENMPVEARPAGAAYRLRKYVKRNRAGVTVAAGAALLVIAFAVVQAVQLRRTTRERDRADRITQFMTSMFKLSDPSEARGNSITVREILDRASKEIETGMANEPELRAQMMFVMGDVYRSLGLYPRAQPLLAQAAETQRRLLGAGNPLTLTTLDELSWILNVRGHSREAETIQRETLDLRRRMLGSENPETIRSMLHLATTLKDETKYAEAEKLGREALALCRRTLGPEHPQTLVAMSNLSQTLSEARRYADAEKLQRESLDLRRRILGAEHPNTLMSMNNLAWILREEGNIAEAEKLFRDVGETQRRILGPEHPDTLRSMYNVATTLRREGRNEESERLHRKVLEIMRRVNGPESRETLGEMDELGLTLYQAGRYEDAEKLQRELVEIMQRALGPEHIDTVEATDNLASTLLVEGREAEARKLEDAMLEIRNRVLGPDHPLTAMALYNFACAHTRKGKYDEALSLLRKAVDHGLPPRDAAAMGEDSDLKPLFGNPRFQELVGYAKQRAAAAK